MSEEDKVLDNDSSITESQQNQDVELVLEDDAEILKAEIAKKDAIIKQVTARAHQAEAKLKNNSVATKETKQPVDGNKEIFNDALELRLQGYSKEEVEFIIKNGGVKSVTDNPFVKAAVETMKEQRKAEQSVSTTDTGKSEIETKFTPEQIAKMSVEELEKHLPHSKI